VTTKTKVWGIDILVIPQLKAFFETTGTLRVFGRTQFVEFFTSLTKCIVICRATLEIVNCFIALESSLMSMKPPFTYKEPKVLHKGRAGLTHKYQTRLKSLSRG
jgi:hypothetical protein